MDRDEFEDLRIDKASISITSLSVASGASDDLSYWLSCTPEARFHHLELLRWINYGPEATARLQRVLEIGECEWR